MTLEVRQLVVKSNVVDDDEAPASRERDCADEVEAAKEDILAEVRRMLRESQFIRGER